MCLNINESHEVSMQFHTYSLQSFASLTKIYSFLKFQIDTIRSGPNIDGVNIVTHISS